MPLELMIYFFKKSHFTILIVSLFVILSSCTSDAPPIGPTVQVVYDADATAPLVTFLVDKKDPLSVGFNNHIRKTINYTKIPYQQLQLATFNNSYTIPASTKVLIIADAAILEDKAITSLIAFLVEGNTLIFTNSSFNEKFGFLAGLKKGATYSMDTIAKGYYFNTALIPNLKGKQFLERPAHFGLKRENFKDTIEILATANNDAFYPTILANKVGNGRVITFNSSRDMQKDMRGLYFATILSGLDKIPYPVANVSTIYLDDFPAPLYNIKAEPILSEFQLNQADFYKNIWWPDLLKLADSQQLKYTGIPCFDYTATLKPPFLFKEWENSNFTEGRKNGYTSDLLMKDLVSRNHELGFHGYNHQSLVDSIWKKPIFIETSLNAVVKHWKTQNYGKLPETYVPPSNIIDSVGIVTLKSAMPSIKNLASIYLGDFNEGGNREFDVEPYHKEVFDFPRITNGYDLSDNNIFDHQSTFLYTGIWNHFIHPDDVYQIPDERNGDSKGAFEFRNLKRLGWRNSRDSNAGMLPIFEKYIKENQELFPLLRALKAKDAVKIVKKWRTQEFSYKIEKDLIAITADIEGLKEAHYWFLYVKKDDLKNVIHTLKKQDLRFTKLALLEGFLIQVETLEPNLVLTALNNNSISEEDSVSARNLVLASLKEYNTVIEKILSRDEKIENFIANENLTDAIILQRNKIKGNSSFITKDWLKLNELYSWNNQQAKTWNFLETEFTKEEASKFISFSKELAQINYPNQDVLKVWFARAIEAAPNDVYLKVAYNSKYPEELFSKLSYLDILNLIQLEDKKILYYNLLIEDYPNKAVEMFNLITPCSSQVLQEMATRISWLFADLENYKKALEWSTCSTEITTENIENWRILSGDYTSLKETNFPKYISYLLQNDANSALLELEGKSPCLDTDLLELHSDIAYAYGNKGRYRKALSWSKCAMDFSKIDEMYWALNLSNYDLVLEIYNNASLKNNDLRLVLIESYLQQKNFKEAYKQAVFMQPGADKDLLLKRLNETVLQLPLEDQEYILNTYTNSLYLAVQEKIRSTLRLSYGSTLEVNSNLLTDKLEPTSFANNVLYTRNDAANNKHSIGFSEYKAYALILPTEQPLNTTENFYGVLYKFQSKERQQKINFAAATMLEFNNSSTFYHINLGANLSKNNLYSSAQLSFKPAITSPAYNLNIYRTQLLIYEELSINEKYQAILNMEGNYYSDNESDILLLAKFGRKFKLNDNTIVIPFIEAAGMLGTSNKSTGFPYWTIDERLYGGVGVNYQYKNEASSLAFGLNSAAFLDTFSGNFYRYGGSIQYPVSAYFSINGSAEFFTIQNFYSNNFSLGLKYYFNK